MFQKKLTDRHAIERDTSKDWQFVAVPNRFRPAQLKFSIDGGFYSVALVALNVRSPEQGGSGKTDVIHFRSKSPEELRKKIERAYPNATFSLAGPPDLKQQHAQELREQKAREAAEAQQAAEEQDFAERVVNAQRELSAEMTPEKRAEANAASLFTFVTQSPWKDWFRAYPGFFAYPSGTSENCKRLFDYCRHHFGDSVFLHGELDQAMRYLLENCMFFMKSNYKRSEHFERNTVKPYDPSRDKQRTLFTPETPEPISSQQIQQVLAALKQRYGSPVQVTVAKLSAIGVRNPENMFAAIRAKYDADCEQTEGKSSAELKRELSAIRPAISRLDRLKGY